MKERATRSSARFQMLSQQLEGLNWRKQLCGSDGFNSNWVELRIERGALRAITSVYWDYQVLGRTIEG